MVRKSQSEMITKLRQEAKIERLTPPPAAPAARRAAGRAEEVELIRRQHCG